MMESGYRMLNAGDGEAVAVEAVVRECGRGVLIAECSETGSREQ